MIDYRIASLPSELTSATKLVTEIYSAEGYTNTKEKKPQKSISDYITEDRSSTILAFKDDQLSGTVTIVRDDNKGLPMDSIFKSELENIRHQYNSIAEICQFAVKRSAFSMDLSFGLLSHAIHILIKEKIDCVCFTVNPKHSAFYFALGAIQIGKEKSYPHVNNAPALALYLDMANFHQPTDMSSFIKKMKSLVPTENFLTTYAQSLGNA